MTSLPNRELFMFYFGLYLDRVFDYFCSIKKDKVNCGKAYNSIISLYNQAYNIISTCDHVNCFIGSSLTIKKVFNHFAYYYAYIFFNDYSHRAAAYLLKAMFGINTIGYGGRKSRSKLYTYIKNKKCSSLELCLLRRAAIVIFGPRSIKKY